jgi:hypothetical protein
MSTVAIADQASGCGAAPIRRNERNGMSTAAVDAGLLARRAAMTRRMPRRATQPVADAVEGMRGGDLAGYSVRAVLVPL